MLGFIYKSVPWYEQIISNATLFLDTAMKMSIHSPEILLFYSFDYQYILLAVNFVVDFSKTESLLE